MFQEYQDVLDISELQTAMGIGRSTAYRLIRSGQIPHLRVGRKIKIPRRYLVDYIEAACYNKATQNRQSNPVNERSTS